MVPLALADRLSLRRGPSPAHATRSTSTGFDAGPLADNLVLRAIAATRGGGPGACRRRRRRPLAARLEKRIPVAAGLAGGSSDAAAAIDGALEAWGADAPADRRRWRVAAVVGSTCRSSSPAARPSSRVAASGSTPLRGLPAASGRPASSS